MEGALGWVAVVSFACSACSLVVAAVLFFRTDVPRAFRFLRNKPLRHVHTKGHVPEVVEEPRAAVVVNERAAEEAAEEAAPTKLIWASVSGKEQECLN